MFYDTRSGASYVGQSVNLGRRVKVHAKGGDPGTKRWLKSLGYDLRVTIYLVPPVDLYGLTLKEFLCVLEQYLFYLEKPTQNNVYVATPGVLLSPAIIERLRATRAEPVYCYYNSPLGLMLVYKFESKGMVGPLFGYDRLWIKAVFRYNGSFGGVLIFKDKLDENAILNLMELPDVIKIHDNALVTHSRAGGVCVTILDTFTGKVEKFNTLIAAAKKLKADRGLFIQNRSKLYRRRYDIKVVSSK